MGRDILVTGISGFIGRAVAKNLASKGFSVIGLDRHPKPVEGAVLIKKGDIMDFDFVAELIPGAEGVINLAGVLGTSELAAEIDTAINLNIRAANNIFQACMKADVPLVQITVGNKDWPSVYPVTKVCAEKLAQIYATDLGARISVVRAMNAYGPWQKYKPVRKLIPNLIRWAMLREPAQIYGDGEQLIDPIHVDDVAEILVRALLYAAEDGDPSAVFEAGTGRAYTVNFVNNYIRALVAMARDEEGSDYPPPAYETMRIGEPLRSSTVADTDTLAPLFDWGAQPLDFIPFLEGMDQVVHWYMDNPQILDI